MVGEGVVVQHHRVDPPAAERPEAFLRLGQQLRPDALRSASGSRPMSASTAAGSSPPRFVSSAAILQNASTAGTSATVAARSWNGNAAASIMAAAYFDGTR
jgi:hypothetical protein